MKLNQSFRSSSIGLRFSSVSVWHCATLIESCARSCGQLTDQDAVRLQPKTGCESQNGCKLFWRWARAATKRQVGTYADDTINVTEAQTRAELAGRDLPIWMIATRAGGTAPVALTLDKIIDFIRQREDGGEAGGG